MWQAGAKGKQLVTLDRAGPVGEGPLVLVLLQSNEQPWQAWEGHMYAYVHKHRHQLQWIPCSVFTHTHTH